MKTFSLSQRFASFVLTVFCLLLLPTAGVLGDAALGDLTPDERNNIDVFQRTNKSVVYVTNSQVRQDYFSLNIHEIPAGAGTGFVWDRKGLIVTNFHVIQGASKIKITLWDRSSWDGKVVGTAPHKDLAVIKIEAPADRLFPIKPGNSNNLDVGRKVLAIGNPFGLDTTLTIGVVSALGREIEAGGRRIKDLIQTDAAINPGNSGGPLLNSKGELVGVNTIIVSSSGTNAGVGFAIPVNTVKDIIPQLIKHGRIMRPIIGITTVQDSIARRYRIKGVIIYQVPQGSNADKAGMVGVRQDNSGNISLGDIITKVDQYPIQNQSDLFNALEEYKPGDTVTLETVLGNRKRTYKIQLTKPE
ncbi:MAG: trypsin-like serine protease [Deltaproteobacteria bacterium]|jgi:S1-C subfamily serine protease|nr:trypsin-like serine protease [Deltaproteobacteria bacterium]MBT4639793.1 trypsin-like serine protease [Deltaproteobacteria bacterium]MBT6499574.1 trypsin-like serine protease [Deltaproteobacteria bacterium]MBT7150890.1 trypsin-like serine protease [Deltaproteobacteria bacterium]MBT7711146.1 trypsin-like serine protease [Deltaproteobacteria bacterium]